MDDKTFKLKNLEFHINQKAKQYENCFSDAVKMFLEKNADFDLAVMPCKSTSDELKLLMDEYENISLN
jgi:hypothetical protein